MSESRGFSLIELLYALLIVGIVLGIAMPGFAKLRNAIILKQANAQVLQDERRARQLAITRRAPVVMRFGSPPAVSNVTSYTIHVDTNGDNLVESNEMVTLRRMPTTTRILTLSLAPVDSLKFDYSGLLLSGTSGGRIVIANQGGDKDTLMISATGVCYRP